MALMWLSSQSVLAEDASRDDRIEPEQLGLPNGTKRTSEPFVSRIYKTDDAGGILQKQPRTHQGVDFSSRPAPGEKPTPLDFNAGGEVVKAGDGPWGAITVQVHDGTLIPPHDRFSREDGRDITPNTKLAAGLVRCLSFFCQIASHEIPSRSCSRGSRQ